MIQADAATMIVTPNQPGLGQDRLDLGKASDFGVPILNDPSIANCAAGDRVRHSGAPRAGPGLTVLEFASRGWNPRIPD